MKSTPTQESLRARLIKWRGDRSQPQAAADIYTPLRTYKSWELGDRPVRGLLRAFLELSERFKK